MEDESQPVARWVKQDRHYLEALNVQLRTEKRLFAAAVAILFAALSFSTFARQPLMVIGGANVIAVLMLRQQLAIWRLQDRVERIRERRRG